MLAEQERLSDTQLKANIKADELFELIDKCNVASLEQPEEFPLLVSSIQALVAELTKQAIEVSSHVMGQQIKSDLLDLSEDAKEGLDFYGDALTCMNHLHVS